MYLSNASACAGREAGFGPGVWHVPSALGGLIKAVLCVYRCGAAAGRSGSWRDRPAGGARCRVSVGSGRKRPAGESACRQARKAGAVPARRGCIAWIVHVFVSDPGDGRVSCGPPRQAHPAAARSRCPDLPRR